MNKKLDDKAMATTKKSKPQKPWRYAWGTIRQRGDSFQVILSRHMAGTGNRFVGTAKAKAEAEAIGQRKQQELKTHGADVLKLSPSFLRAAAEASRMLTEKGFQDSLIIEATQDYIKQNDATAKKKLLSEVYDEYLRTKQNIGLRPATLKGYKEKLHRFAEQFGKKYMHEIDAATVEAWFDSLNFRVGNRREYKRHISMFYKFGISRKYVKENIGQAITRPHKTRTAPVILNPQEIRMLLFEAKKHNLGLMLPYFAIGAFCGIRPEEIKRLTWADLDFDEKHIYISVENAKCGDDRYVDMPDCLIQWLAFMPEENRNGLVYFSRGPFNKVRKKAGIKWQSDVLRHSAASHMYAKTQNAAHVTAQMGHGLGVFMKYYKKCVTKKQGAEYFEVRPTDKNDNAINLNKAKIA